MESTLLRMHRELLATFLSRSKGLSVSPKSVSYDGNTDPTYDLSSPITKKIACDWLKKYKELDQPVLMSFIDKLYLGESATEKYFAGILLAKLPSLRSTVMPAHLDVWLDHLSGWCEVDSLCQPVFTAKDMGAKWSDWKDLLIKLSQSPNINKRRASLVLLTKPVREVGDVRFSTLAFRLVTSLKTEKGILITKAVSWLLRHLIKWHRDEVEEYLKLNETTLPKIAVREVTTKLRTGRKAS